MWVLRVWLNNKKKLRQRKSFLHFIAMIFQNKFNITVIVTCWNYWEQITQKGRYMSDNIWQYMSGIGKYPTLPDIFLVYCTSFWSSKLFLQRMFPWCFMSLSKQSGCIKALLCSGGALAHASLPSEGHETETTFFSQSINFGLKQMLLGHGHQGSNVFVWCSEVSSHFWRWDLRGLTGAGWIVWHWTAASGNWTVFLWWQTFSSYVCVLGGFYCIPFRNITCCIVSRWCYMLNEDRECHEQKENPIFQKQFLLLQSKLEHEDSIW